MKMVLANLLSINPLLSLALVVGYITFLWYATVTIWGNGHEFFAIVFVLTISIAVKSQSTGLIDELKRIKLEKTTG
jgi:hypothetical protein